MSRARLSKTDSGLSYAEERHRTVPLNVREHYCKCEDPEKVPYISWMRRTENSPLEEYEVVTHRFNQCSPLGMYCNQCSKPMKYTLAEVIRPCEVCGTYYVPDPRPYTYPIKTFLCDKHFQPSRQLSVLKRNYPDFYTVIEKMEKETDFYERTYLSRRRTKVQPSSSGT